MGKKAKELKEIVVAEIVPDGDRLLLYGVGEERHTIKYHIIAEPGEQVAIGDVVEYEPCGMNFGWFKRIKKKKEE